MTKEKWLKAFKNTVRKATEARLAGNIQQAQWLDRSIERYYKEAKKRYHDDYHFDEEYLFEVESDIREEQKCNLKT